MKIATHKYHRIPVKSLYHNSVGGRHEMLNPRGVENAIVRREDGPAWSSLVGSLTCGISTRRSCPNCCCPADDSVRGSRSRCNWDEVSLRGVTLPDLACDGAGVETAVQMRIVPS